MKVYVHLAEGFEEIEAVTVIDILRRAGIDAEAVSVTGNLFVAGAHAITIKADLLFEEADYDKCCMIVLPGGLPGTTNLSAHKGITDQIKKFAAEDKWLAAICAAPTVFGKIGLLEGRKAVVYPGMEKFLTGAKPGKKTVETDGRIITSKAPGTAMEFAFTLVETLKDKAIANQLKKAMLFEK